MEILNIGPLELVLIVLIALIVLGPNETINAMRKLGKLISKVAKSPYWSTIMNTSKEIRDLPNMIVREAQLEESINELKKTTDDLNTDVKNINKTIKEDIEEVNKTIDKDEIISRKDIPKIEFDSEKKDAQKEKVSENPDVPESESSGDNNNHGNEIGTALDTTEQENKVSNNPDVPESESSGDNNNHGNEIGTTLDTIEQENPESDSEDESKEIIHEETNSSIDNV